jgi:hypothetical protein
VKEMSNALPEYDSKKHKPEQKQSKQKGKKKNKKTGITCREPFRI